MQFRFVWERDQVVDILSVNLDEAIMLSPFEKLMVQVTDKLRGGSRLIMFDATGLDFFDGHAANALNGCVRLARQMKAAFVLLNPHSTLLEGLEQARIHRTVPYRWDRNEAIEEMQRSLKADDPTEELARTNSSSFRPSHLVRVDRVMQMTRRRQQVVRQGSPPGRTVPGAEEIRADWQRMLKVRQQARELAEKYGIDFTPQMTFEQFEAKMAERMQREG
jgi:anti-anti-sigma regulatory factor